MASKLSGVHLFSRRSALLVKCGDILNVDWLETVLRRMFPKLSELGNGMRAPST